MKDNLDHKLRFDTIDLFKKVITDFKKTDGIQELQKETQNFVDVLKKIEDPSEFITGLIDTVDRQTVTMLAKEKYVQKWGEH